MGGLWSHYLIGRYMWQNIYNKDYKYSCVLSNGKWHQNFKCPDCQWYLIVFNVRSALLEAACY